LNLAIGDAQPHVVAGIPCQCFVVQPQQALPVDVIFLRKGGAAWNFAPIERTPQPTLLQEGNKLPGTRAQLSEVTNTQPHCHTPHEDVPREEEEHNEVLQDKLSREIILQNST